MNSNIISPTDLQLNDEHVIQIKRVSKATTGGRRMRFSSIVCVGDGQGHVGIGFGRANEVASAVNKAKNSAKKRIFKSPLVKHFHETGKCSLANDDISWAINLVSSWVSSLHRRLHTLAKEARLPLQYHSVYIACGSTIRACSGQIPLFNIFS